MGRTFQDNRLLDPTVQGMLLDRIKQMHGSGFQQDVQWGDVYKNGAYDFGKYDALVNAARAKGLNDITFRLYGTPRYVETTRPGIDASLSASHPNAALAGKFAEQVAQHFSGRVSRYGVWDEPNIGGPFLNQANARTRASNYRQIYRQMYRSLKGVDSRNRVGFGELTANQPNSRGADSTLGFLRTVLSMGDKPLHADYLGLHPYQWSDPSRQVGNSQYGGVSNLTALQRALAGYAHSGKLLTSKGARVPLAVSEFGYKHDVGNAAQRAAWMHRSMKIFRRAGVKDVNLYQLLPSRAGDYWDSSILDSHGNLPPAMRRALMGR